MSYLVLHFLVFTYNGFLMYLTYLPHNLFSIKASHFLFNLLRGTILNRTYGTHKNLHISLFLPTIFSYLIWSPVIISSREATQRSPEVSRPIS